MNHRMLERSPLAQALLDRWAHQRTPWKASGGNHHGVVLGGRDPVELVGERASASDHPVDRLVQLGGLLDDDPLEVLLESLHRTRRGRTGGDRMVDCVERHPSVPTIDQAALSILFGPIGPKVGLTPEVPPEHAVVGCDIA